MKNIVIKGLVDLAATFVFKYYKYFQNLVLVKNGSN